MLFLLLMIDLVTPEEQVVIQFLVGREYLKQFTLAHENLVEIILNHTIIQEDTKR